MSKGFKYSLMGLGAFAVVTSIMIGSYFYMNQEEDVVEVSLPVNNEVLVTEEEDIITEEISDPTADWNVYENQEFGFRIRYPDDYIVDESNMQNENPMIQLLLKDLIYNSEFDILHIYNPSFESELYLGTMFVEDETQLDPVSVENVLYDFQRIFSGEGAAGFTNSQTYDTIYLKNDLSVDIYVFNEKIVGFPEECNEYSGIHNTTGEKCESILLETFEVSEEYIELTRQVIETIEYL